MAAFRSRPFRPPSCSNAGCRRPGPLPLPDEMRASDLRLGVCLTGKGGGEWVLSVEGAS